MRTPGKRVCRKATRVRIPAHPCRCRRKIAPLMMRVFAVILLCLAIGALTSRAQNLAASALERARQEFKQGRLETALKALEDAEQGGEPTAPSLDLRGCILVEQEKLDDAVRAFAAANAKEASDSTRVHLANALLRQGKWDDARAAYQAATKETVNLVSNERLRFGVLMTFLGAKDDPGVQLALNAIRFPTESAAYYYAQAAWSFAHDAKRDAEKWIARAEEIHPANRTAWFARPLFDCGWLKKKPPLFYD